MLNEAPKGQGIRVDNDRHVLLNIVPTDVAETAELRVGIKVQGERSPTLTPELFPENKENALSTAKTAPLQLIRSPAVEPVELPLPVAPVAPAPRRTGLLVVLSMGGGVLLGSGAMTAIAILGLMLAGIGATAVLLLWFASASPALVAVEMPVAVPATATENPAAEVPVADIVTPANDASAGGPSPSAVAPSAGSTPAAPKPNTPPAVAGTTPPTTAPAPAASAPAAPAPAAPASATPTASAPAAPAPAAPAPATSAAGGLISVKILSNPPAALLAVDGEPHGRTPTKLDLEPGTHSITLTAGSSKGTFSIDVAPGDDKFCYGLSGKKLIRTSCD